MKKCPKGTKLKKGSCVVSKKNSNDKMGNAMKIFLGVALTIIFFGLFNLGISTFYNSPQYSDYCEIGNKVDGTFDYQQCNQDFEQARENYSNSIFYILVVGGLIFAIAGLFVKILPFQIVGLGGGTALIIEGILRNLSNRVPAFIAGVLVFGIISYFVWRKFK